MRRDAVALAASLLISAPVFAADATPPARPIVSDEGASTTSLTQLRATWRSADPESGIVEYQSCIRRGWRYGPVLVPWRSNGTATSVTQTDLKLLRGRTYYVCVKAKNGAGLWSSPGCSDGIRVETPVPSASRRPPNARTDTTPPTGAISMNGGALYTTSRIVTLTLAATDDSGTVWQMQVSNDRRRYTAPEPYAPIKRWVLPHGDGAHTVYVRFCDQEGNWSEAASDTIMLDTVMPWVLIRYPTHGMLLGGS